MQTIKKIVIAILGGVFLFAPILSFAQTAGQGGIQISPLTFNFEVKPGESKQGVINVTNLNSETINYVLEKENFSGVSEEGAPDFSKTELREGVTSLADWITFDAPTEGTLAPKEKKDFSFNINIPQGAEPGGHYAAVFAKQVKKTAEGKTELGVASRVGALILVTVPGVTTKAAEIVEFKAPKIVWKGPVGFTAKVRNTGTVHFDSKSTVDIRSILGAQTAVDMGTHTVLPDNTRQYEGKWNKKYPFGYYRLTISATDGEGKPVSQSAGLWAIPLVVVIPVIALILIIVLAIRYIRKHFRVVTKQ